MPDQRQNSKPGDNEPSAHDRLRWKNELIRGRHSEMDALDTSGLSYPGPGAAARKSTPYEDYERAGDALIGGAERVAGSDPSKLEKAAQLKELIERERGILKKREAGSGGMSEIMKRHGIGASKGAQAAGRGAQAAGAGVEAAGVGVDVAGKGVDAAGKGVGAAGKGMMSAGAALSGTGIGAIVGVPLAIAGGAAVGAGVGMQAGGKGMQATGKGMRKAGASAVKGGKQLGAMAGKGGGLGKALPMGKMMGGGKGGGLGKALPMGKMMGGGKGGGLAELKAGGDIASQLLKNKKLRWKAIRKLLLAGNVWTLLIFALLAPIITGGWILFSIMMSFRVSGKEWILLAISNAAFAFIVLGIFAIVVTIACFTDIMCALEAGETLLHEIDLLEIILL